MACPSVCPYPHGDPSMVMYSAWCSLTSTYDSGEELEGPGKETWPRVLHTACSAATIGGLSPPTLWMKASLFGSTCSLRSLCPLLPTRAHVSAHPPCPGKAGAVSDVSIPLRGARWLTLIVILGTSQCRNENGTHGYLNLSISFLLMFSPDDFLAV